MKYISILTLLIGLISLNACKDNPVKDHDGDHEEAEGVVIKESGAELVRYENGVVNGSISITVGIETALLNVSFIAEDGDLFVPDDDSELTLSVEIADEAIVSFEQHAEDGKWSFHLHGESVGTTTIRIVLDHDGHADFRSLPIDVTVNPAS